MPNHKIPIEEADLWDILDYEATMARSLEAVGDPRDARPGNQFAWLAKFLIDAPDHPKAFEKICRRYITGLTDKVRRNQAADLARIFNADPKRLIDFIGLRIGWFKKKGRAKQRQT
jgi:hypothetical protein